jgi:hypothetical protein
MSLLPGVACWCCLMRPGVAAHLIGAASAAWCCPVLLVLLFIYLVLLVLTGVEGAAW